MAKYIKLDNTQKDEIRRLTQLANRRIRAVAKEYKKQGLTVLPREVAGKHQVTEQWMSSKNPISRSTRFTSEREYRKQLSYLRSFERWRPNVTEFNVISRQKTTQAVETSLGSISKELEDKLNRMTAPELSQFWKEFSKNASKLGIKYSSEAAINMTMRDIFPEDYKKLEGA